MAVASPSDEAIAAPLGALATRTTERSSVTERERAAGPDPLRPRSRVAGAELGAVSLERRAPRSAGLAGIAFSLLFLGFAVLLGTRPPEGLTEAGLVDWFERTAKGPITLATLYVAPFAGIAFLWFLAVVRDRIGDREDRFLATVFLGSGLVFVAMFWAAAAALASLVAGERLEAAPPLSAATLESTRSLAFSFLFVMAARAAAVFMIVTSTIALRTAIFPRWLIIASYVIALVMLLSLASLQWVVLLFPLWVFVMSIYILNGEIRAVQGAALDADDSAH